MADLCEPHAWREPLDGIDTVVHLAALAHQVGKAGRGRREEFRRTNAEATGVLACACRSAGVRRLIFLSSVAANEMDGPMEPTDYGRSKREAEQLIESELRASSTDWCILRPPLIYGPGNPGNMARLMKLIQLGLPLPFASIRNVRSFLFIDNLVDAIVAVARHAQPIRATFTLTDGTDVSTPNLVRRLAMCSGRRPLLFPVPKPLLRLIGRGADAAGFLLRRSLPFDSYSIDKLVGSMQVDGAAFRAAFSWQPPVSPERGLQATCDAMLERRAQ